MPKEIKRKDMEYKNDHSPEEKKGVFFFPILLWKPRLKWQNEDQGIVSNRKASSE